MSSGVATPRSLCSFTPPPGADRQRARRRRRGATARGPRPSAVPEGAAGDETDRDAAESRRSPPRRRREMPEVTEEEWRHRIETRKRTVFLGKDTLEYQRRLQGERRGEVDEEPARTPDPSDRTASRRRWKYSVMVWRSSLRRLFLRPGEVSVRLGPKGDLAADPEASSAGEVPAWADASPGRAAAAADRETPVHNGEEVRPPHESQWRVTLAQSFGGA